MTVIAMVVVVSDSWEMGCRRSVGNRRVRVMVKIRASRPARRMSDILPALLAPKALLEEGALRLFFR